jgi:hypothetical protein
MLWVGELARGLPRAAAREAPKRLTMSRVLTRGAQTARGPLGIVAPRVTQLRRNRAHEGEPVALWWFYRDWRVRLIIPA